MGAQTGGDAAELGAGAGGDDDAAAAARVHDGAHQRAPGQLGQRGARRHRGGVLVDRQRLAGQHRLVAFQTGHRQQPDVGRDDAAQAQLDQVTGDQAGDIDLDRVAVAHHHGLVADLRMQRLGGLLGPVLVDETQPDRQPRR